MMPQIQNPQQHETLRTIQEVIKTRFGQPFQVLNILAHSDSVLQSYIAFEMQFESVLANDEQLKELIYFKVAMILDCPFCLDIGQWLALKSGLPKSKLAAINQPDNSIFSERERMALMLATKLCLNDCDISDADRQILLSQFSEQEVVELMAIIAWENFRSRLNKGLGILSQHFYDDDISATANPKPEDRV